MAARNIIDIFEDCLQRMDAGQSVDDCLNVYPQFAAVLRPMLETGRSVSALQFPVSEILQDQALVWADLEKRLPILLPAARRRPRFGGLLLAAALMLAVTMAIAYLGSSVREEESVVLTVPALLTATENQPTLTPLMSETSVQVATETVSATVTLTRTPTATLTRTPTATLTHTPTVTLTRTLPRTPVPRNTATATATFAPGCGAPLSEQDAIARVLTVYPNTVIVEIEQQVKYGGVLVWEVKTSHGLEINIGVACGNIITIEQSGSGSSGDGSSDSGDDASDDSADSPDDSDSDDDSNSSGGSDDSEPDDSDSSDDSGSGSDDDPDDPDDD